MEVEKGERRKEGKGRERGMGRRNLMEGEGMRGIR